MPRRTVAAAVVLGTLGLLGAFAGCSVFEGFAPYPDGGEARDRHGPADVSTDGGADSGPPLPSCNGGSGFCAPPPPPQWAGPAIFYEGPAAADCVSGYTRTYQSPCRPSGAPASCMPCTCNAAALACDSQVKFYDTACAGSGPVDAGAYPTGSCVTVPSMSTGTGYPDTALSVASSWTGSCSVAGGQVLDVPDAWASYATACAPTAAASQSTCDPGSFCLPLIPGPFPHRFCVSRAGDWTCPPGGYPAKYAAYDGGTEGRGCAPCSCGAPAGSCPTPVVEGCNGYKCGAGCTPATAAGAGCFTFTQASISVSSAPPTGASCPAAGGGPQGSFTPTGPTTFCCTE